MNKKYLVQWLALSLRMIPMTMSFRKILDRMVNLLTIGYMSCLFTNCGNNDRFVLHPHLQAFSLCSRANVAFLGVPEYIPKEVFLLVGKCIFQLLKFSSFLVLD